MVVSTAPLPHLARMSTAPTIDRARFQADVDALARIGAVEDNGVTRLAYSEAHRAARRYVEDALADIGATVQVDAIGNLFGILDTGRDGPTVMTGSHTDSVGRGGRFDGSLGVAAGLATGRHLRTHPGAGHGRLIVADFMNEEGARFMPDMMGSLFVRGDLSAADVRSATDSAGITAGDEIDRLNFAGAWSLDPTSVDAFVELHIEQGPVLEQAQQSIGIVTGVQGLRWLRVTCSGASNHAGTTPMHGRRDAHRAAAALIEHIYQLADEIDGLRVTVGAIESSPNQVNVIADQCRFTVDIRHPAADVLLEAERSVRARIRAADMASSCDVGVDDLADAAPVDFDETVIQAVSDSVAELGLTSRRMISGAGHDAQILAAVIPSGMVFIPSRGGISHHPDEYSSPEDTAVGADVILGTVLRLMEGP